MTTQALTTTTRQAALTVTTFEEFKLLSIHDDSGPIRPDFLACISAGYKDAAKGVPVVSRDGTMYLSDPSGRAPGLADALKATEGKSLTITVPSDDPNHFIHAHYRREGKTRLEAFGDASGITVLDGQGGRQFYPAGTPDFLELRKTCKVTYEIAFYLAGWELEQGRPVPKVYWPDGMGIYRIRTSSESSVKALLARLSELHRLFQGQVAGIPLEVRLVYPTKARATGEKSKVPVFSFIFKPPSAMAFSGDQFRAIVESATAILPSLSLLAPPDPLQLEEAIAEFEDNLLSIPLDAAAARAKYFAIAGETKLAQKEGRAAFLMKYTGGEYDSLAAFLADCEPADMAAMLEALEDAIAADLPAAAGEHQVLEVVKPEVVADDAPITPAQMKAIGEQLVRLGWSKPKASAYCKKAFGKAAAGELTLVEAEELLEDLAGMQTESGEA